MQRRVACERAMKSAQGRGLCASSFVCDCGPCARGRARGCGLREGSGAPGRRLCAEVVRVAVDCALRLVEGCALEVVLVAEGFWLCVGPLEGSGGPHDRGGVRCAAAAGRAAPRAIGRRGVQCCSARGPWAEKGTQKDRCSLQGPILGAAGLGTGICPVTRAGERSGLRWRGSVGAPGRTRSWWRVTPSAWGPRTSVGGSASRTKCTACWEAGSSLPRPRRNSS